MPRLKTEFQILNPLQALTDEGRTSEQRQVNAVFGKPLEPWQVNHNQKPWDVYADRF